MSKKRHFLCMSALCVNILCMSACTTGPHPLPPTEVRTVEVKVPVPVPCVERSALPGMPAKVGNLLTGDAVHDLDVVAASNLRLRTALDKALALLGACVSG
jgi:hypothetical protein